jgi:long-chain acyl-CoA synthetase
MINIDFDAVGNWAERRNLPYAGYTDLAQKPEVYQLIKECVEKVNADLAADACWPAARSAASWCCTRSWTPTTASSPAPTRSAAATSPRSTTCWSMRCTAASTEQFIETQVKFEDGRTGSVSATLKIDDTKTFAAW